MRLTSTANKSRRQPLLAFAPLETLERYLADERLARQVPGVRFIGLIVVFHGWEMVFCDTVQRWPRSLMNVVATSRPLRSVMVPCRDESHGRCFDSIDQTVFLVDTPGPSARKLSSERFRFTRSAEGISYYSLDQFEDAKRAPPVGADPVLQVVQTVLVEERIPAASFPHVPSRPSRSRSCSMLSGMPSPAAARRLPSSRRCAFLGERSR